MFDNSPSCDHFRHHGDQRKLILEDTTWMFLDIWIISYHIHLPANTVNAL